MAKDYNSLFKQYVKVAFVFGCHLLLVAISIVGIYALEQLIERLWGHDAPMVFGMFPLKYLFQAIDVAIVAVFGVRSTVEIYQMLGDER